MFKTLFFISCWLFWSECRADVQISSDFYFAVGPQSYTASLLKEPLVGKESFTVPSWNIGGEYQSSAENIQMDFDYALTLQATAESTKYSYLLRLEKGSLRIGKIKTDAVIKKNVGGVQATVYLKGECRNLVITTEDALELIGNVRLGVKNQTLGAFLQGLDSQNEQHWTMSVEACEGPKGYQQALEQQLREFIANKQKMQDVLMQPFQSQIDKKVAGIHNQLFAEKQMALNADIEVVLAPKSVELDEQTGHLLLSGIVKANIKNPKEEQKHVEATLSKEEFSQLSQNGFLISQKYLSALVDSLHESGFFYKSYLAQQIPGLSTLFKSRLFQFFLWPDLLNFRKNAAFSFELGVKKKPEVKLSSMHKGSAWFSLNTELSVLTKTPENVGANDYGHFLSPFQSQAWLRVYEGKLALGFHQPKMNLKFKWSDLYLKTFRPFQFLSASFFGQKMASSLKDFRWATPLPAIEVEGQALLRPQALSGNENWLVLEYAPGN